MTREYAHLDGWMAYVDRDYRDRLSDNAPSPLTQSVPTAFLMASTA
jgi:hypothetical protein